MRLHQYLFSSVLCCFVCCAVESIAKWLSFDFVCSLVHLLCQRCRCAQLHACATPANNVIPQRKSNEISRPGDGQQLSLTRVDSPGSVECKRHAYPFDSALESLIQNMQFAHRHTLTDRFNNNNNTTVGSNRCLCCCFNRFYR